MSEQKQWAKQIFRVVCVVHDLDATLANWKQMVYFDEASIRVGTSAVTRYARFSLGGVEMELAQPLQKDGTDAYATALREKGQGFHHIGICVEDYEAFLEKYRALGMQPVYEEKTEEDRCLLFSLDSQIGMTIAPWRTMTGPCATTVMSDK